ncbi:DUF4153 domain-containing protein [Budvicia diplopodorum]|uniref:DUF4153 domain-containing protein n=1 Tax=Budvicia diplopodorum TaxID=1119056 RepID=UPI00135C3626|nr:DUF4153 domain-containing protein [Budvicia diplopodorum]
MTTNTPLPKSSLIAIILLGLLQGGFLYLTRDNYNDGGMMTNPSLILLCNTLFLTLPVMLSLSVISLKDFRVWRGLAIVLVILLIMASWANWSLDGVYTSYRRSSITAHYYVCLTAFVFLTVAWLQAHITQKTWFPSYEALHDNLWLNSLTVVLTLIFMGLLWGILKLCASLFSMLGIEFFERLFFHSDLFIYLANGFIVSIGILTGRTQTHFIQVGRNVLSVIIKGLLPLLAFIALIFIITLPFVGLNALTAKWSSAGLLTTMVALLIVFVNAVYQTGLAHPPYPKAMRWLVNAAILVLPVYSLFALYSMWVRVAQYGWTPDRIDGVIIICVALCFACGYAVAVLRSRHDWLRPLGSINRIMSLVMIALLVLVNSPVLDPYRISVNNQMTRLEKGVSTSKDLNLDAWGSEYGRVGHEALLALKNNPDYVSDSRRKVELEVILAKESKLYSSLNPNGDSPGQKNDGKDKDRSQSVKLVVENMQKNMVLATGTPALPAELLSLFINDNGENDIYQVRECVMDAQFCVAASVDVNSDGKADYLVCNFYRADSPSCVVFVNSVGKWIEAGSIYSVSSDVKGFEQALRNGEFKAKARTFSDLEVGGQRVNIQYSINEP